MKLNFTITDEFGGQKVFDLELNDKKFETTMECMIRAIAGIQENYHVESIAMNCKIAREQEEN